MSESQSSATVQSEGARAESATAITGEIIKKLNTEKSAKEQQECLKELQQLSLRTGDDSVKHCIYQALIETLFRSKLQPVRTTTLRLITSLRGKDDLLRAIAETSVQQILAEHRSIVEGKKSLYNWNNFISAFAFALDLPIVAAILKQQFWPIFKCTDKFIDTNLHIMQRDAPMGFLLDDEQNIAFIHNGIKFLLNIVQKEYKQVEEKKETCLDLVKCCYFIICNKRPSFETKTNCGYLSAHILFNSLAKDRTVVTSRDLTLMQKTFFAALPQSDGELLEVFKMVNFVGIIIATQSLNVQLSNDLVMKIFMKLLHWGASRERNSSELVALSKGLSLVSASLHKLSFTDVKRVFNGGMDHVLIYLNDKSEVVRDLTTTMFNNLIDTAKHFEKQGQPGFLTSIFVSIKGLPDDSVFYLILIPLCTKLTCSTVMEEIPDLPRSILANLENSSRALSICNCYQALMTKHFYEGISQKDWLACWVDEVVKRLRNSSAVLVEHFQKLLIAALKLVPETIKTLLNDNSDNNLTVLLNLMVFAQKNGIEARIDESGVVQWKKYIKCETLDVLKTYYNDEIRIAALALVVEHHRKTEIFTEWELNFLNTFLYYNINTQNANVRQQMLSLYKKAFDRFTAGCTLIVKSTAVAGTVQTVVELDNHKSFLNMKLDQLQSINAYYSHFWQNLMSKILLPCINLDSNFGRRKTSLMLLNMIADRISRDEFSGYLHEADILNLKRLVQFDTYEQNKELGAKLLSLLPLNLMGFHNEDVLQEHIDEAIVLMQSLKPIEAITSMYMLRPCLTSKCTINLLQKKLSYKYTSNNQQLLLVAVLLNEYETSLALAKRDLQEAALKRPVHGMIYCIRYILGGVMQTGCNDVPELATWRELLARFIDLNMEMSTLLGTIIYNASVEGYVLDYNPDEVTDNSAKAQILSVYGWRAIKEISLFFGELASNATFCDDSNGHVRGLMDEAKMQRVGDFFQHLMVNAKHRGAFEQGAIGYTNFCARLWKEPKFNHQPELLLKNMLNSVVENKDTQDACVTRRSGGLPFMIQSILITEPATQANELLHFTFRTLLDACLESDCVSEVKIHSINILRALYKHNQLGDIVSMYVAEGVMIAIKGFAHRDWAIRNSATLLFSSLITRIFGVQRNKGSHIICVKNKLPAKVFFRRYPTLYPYLLSVMQKGVAENNSQTLYPTLLILNRLYPSCFERFSLHKLSAFMPFVDECLKNSNYRIRDLAAITAISLSEAEHADLLMECVEKLADFQHTNNYCHGNLLLMSYIVKTADLAPLELVSVVEETLWILMCAGIHVSHTTASLYIKSLFRLITGLDQNKHEDREVLEKLYVTVIYHVKKLMHDQFISTSTVTFRLHMFCLTIQLIFKNVENAFNASMLSRKLFKKVLAPLILHDRNCRDLALNMAMYLKYSREPFACHFNEDNMEYADLTEHFLNGLTVPIKYELARNLFAIFELYRQHDTTWTTDIDVELALLHPNSFYNDIGSFISVEPVQDILDVITKIDAMRVTVSCVQFACMRELLTSLSDAQVERMQLKQLLEVIIAYAQPTVDAQYRLAVSDLLVGLFRAFCRDDFTATFVKSVLLWQAIFLLLEDDDEQVRKEIIKLHSRELVVQKEIACFSPAVRTDIASCTRELLIRKAAQVIPRDEFISFILSWILKSSKEEIKFHEDTSQVFDKGESNAYAELVPFAKYCSLLLHDLLWDADVSNSGPVAVKRIEAVATIVYNRVRLGTIWYISTSMYKIMCQVLRSVINFLRDTDPTTATYRGDFKACLETGLASETVHLDMSELLRCTTLLSFLFREIMWDECELIK